ncbi:MAG: helix-turn-helix domain-containing protein, partial [Boseongicola sp. SB0665_bin_10]|nr:helix-turn-helix domain-containing protein [Boseongicola sp. SB0665_bin_10]
MEHEERGKTEQTIYLDTQRAARRPGLSAKTLSRYRVSRGGPVFHRFCSRIRYRRDDLEAWAPPRLFEGCLHLERACLAVCEVGETACCDERSVVGAVDACHGGALHVEGPSAERLEDPCPESRIVDERPAEAPGAVDPDAWIPARIRAKGLAPVRQAFVEGMRPAIPGPRLLNRQVPVR